MDPCYKWRGDCATYYTEQIELKSELRFNFM